MAAVHKKQKNSNPPMKAMKYEKKRFPLSTRGKILTAAGSRLPHLTNQSFPASPPAGGAGEGSSSQGLGAVISKINRRLDRQKRLMAQLLDRALQRGKGPGRGQARGGARGRRRTLSRAQQMAALRAFKKGQIKGTVFSPIFRASVGVVTLECSGNNTLLTLTRGGGRLVRGGWASGGSLGFKNSAKSTVYASQTVAKSLVSKARRCGIRALHLRLKGRGRTKAAVVRTLNKSPLKILTIKECTAVVHNGCRRPKARRI